MAQAASSALADNSMTTFEITLDSATSDGVDGEYVSFVMVEKYEDGIEGNGDDTRLNRIQPKVLYVKRSTCTCEVAKSEAAKFWREPVNNIESYIVGPNSASSVTSREGYVRFAVQLNILCLNARSWPMELKMMPHEVRRFRYGLESAKRLRQDTLNFWQEKETCALGTTGYIEDDLVYRFEFARRVCLIYEIALVTCNAVGREAELRFAIAIREWDVQDGQHVYSKGEYPQNDIVERSKGAMVGTFTEEGVDAILSYINRNYVEYLPLPLFDNNSVEINM